MQYPQTMQPTHARWEPVHDSVDEAASNMKQLTTEAHAEGTATPEAAEPKDTIFPPVKPIITNNFLVLDTLFQNAAYSNLCIPGPDGSDMDRPFTLNTPSSISQDLIDELPEDCRKALGLAREREANWKGQWKTESEDAMRRRPIIDKGMIL